MSNQTNIIRFTRSIKNDVILPILTVPFGVAYIIISDPEKFHRLYPTPTPLIIMCCGLMAYMVALIAWMQIQRVEIDTENQTVCFANSGTYHLWRTFSLRDVISIRVLTGRSPRIDIELSESSSRTWAYVRLNNPDADFQSDYIDSPLSLALVQQIHHMHPDKKIIIVSRNYRGSLPKEICEFDQRW